MVTGVKEVSGETTVAEAPTVQSLSSPNTDNTSYNSETNGVRDSSASIANGFWVLINTH
uniref:Uncharacterized protein n=1 Tax=Solanum lycopersicum TaxID=4081 RepID=A0A3Q7G271_SOLLC